MAEIDWKDARLWIAENLVYSNLNAARAFLALDALVGEMAALIERRKSELDFIASELLEGSLEDHERDWRSIADALLARAKEVRGG